MKWFKHESRAHRDAKLRKVLMRYGFEGYGLYWYCIENICASLEPDLNFELEHDSEILAHEGKMDSRRVEEIMRYMVELGLFESSDGVISCLKLARFLGESGTRDARLKTIIKRAKTEDLSQTVSDGLRRSQIVSLREDKIREEKILTSETGVSAPVPFQKILETYHTLLPGLSKVRALSKSREASVRRRHKGVMGGDLANWSEYFQRVSSSDFLMGRIDGKDWRADFDFLITERNALRVLEGRYDNRQSAGEGESYL